MIFVDRTAVHEPQALKDAWAIEKGEVDHYYSPANIAALRKELKRGDPKSYKFKAYLAAKKPLEQLFNKKCAYCESEYLALLTGEIEHYRPKGVIVTGTETRKWPGYYWLAASWSNLVPVCSLCNKKNKLEDLTDGVTRTVGKGERFPLIDESARATPGMDPAREQPLLIDPCNSKSKPEEHLVISERDGHQGLLIGRTEQGKSTVTILGLNRTELVRRRVKHLIMLQGLMADIDRAMTQAARAATQLDQDVALKEISDKKKQLEDYASDKAEYVALARHVIRPFLSAMAGIATTANQLPGDPGPNP